MVELICQAFPRADHGVLRQSQVRMRSIAVAQAFRRSIARSARHVALPEPEPMRTDRTPHRPHARCANGARPRRSSMPGSLTAWPAIKPSRKGAFARGRGKNKPKPPPNQWETGPKTPFVGLRSSSQMMKRRCLRKVYINGARPTAVCMCK